VQHASIGRALLESRGDGERVSVEVDVDDFWSPPTQPASQPANVSSATARLTMDQWLGRASDAEQHMRNNNDAARESSVEVCSSGSGSGSSSGQTRLSRVVVDWCWYTACSSYPAIAHRR